MKRFRLRNIVLILLAMASTGAAISVAYNDYLDHNPKDQIQEEIKDETPETPKDSETPTETPAENQTN